MPVSEPNSLFSKTSREQFMQGNKIIRTKDCAKSLRNALGSQVFVLHCPVGSLLGIQVKQH